jgi:uncharacterized BrkB/YihY/UPF0761 family membrane protein
VRRFLWFAIAWLLGFLYRLAPSRMLTRADLLPGAGLAALVIVGLGYALPLYTQLTAQLAAAASPAVVPSSASR